MVVAVAPGDTVLLGEMMVQFDIKLPRRKFRQNRGVVVEFPRACIVDRRLRVKVDNRLSDRVDQAGVNHVWHREVLTISPGVYVPGIKDALLDRFSGGTAIRAI